MWFPAIWLAIGFATKWAGEYWEKWSEDVFRFLHLVMSFVLIIVSFSVLHLSIWQSMVVFFFWILVTDMMKPKS